MAIIKQRDKRTGIVYAIEAEARWDPEKKQTRYSSRRVVGHFDPETGEVVPNRAAARPAAAPAADEDPPARAFCGRRLLLDAVAEESGLSAALRAAAPGDWERLLSLAYYMVCEDSSPMSRFAHFARVNEVPCGGPLASQRISELLAGVTDAQRASLCSSLAARHAAGDRLFYDTTSISSYSESLRQARWGKNKDGVPLRQVNLALVAGRDCGIPLHYRKLAGNISDVSTVKALLADMDPKAAGRVALVMDRGFWSAENINAMMREHLKFLIGGPSHLKIFRDAVAAHSAELRTWANYDPDLGVFGMRVAHEWAYEQKRPRKGDVLKGKRRSYIYLYFDPSRRADDERDLAELLACLHRELESGNRVELHEGYYDRFFRLERGRWVGRDEEIASANEGSGYFWLFSNEAMDASEALRTYRSKDAVEKRFSDLKGPLDGRTTRCSDERALDGRIFVAFVALVLESWLRRRMGEAGLSDKWTLRSLLDEVSTIERFRREGRRPRIGEVTAKQAGIFKALGYELPTTS